MPIYDSREHLIGGCTQFVCAMLIFVALIFLCGCSKTNPSSPSEKETENPWTQEPLEMSIQDGYHICFIGNSHHQQGVDFDVLDSNISAGVIERVSTTSVGMPWFYSRMAELLRRPTPPDVIVLLTVLDGATNLDIWDHPTARAKAYEEIGEKKTIRERVDSLLSLYAEEVVPWDFGKSVGVSLLPSICELLEGTDTRLILSRMRFYTEVRDLEPSTRETRRRYNMDLTDSSILSALCITIIV